MIARGVLAAGLAFALVLSAPSARAKDVDGTGLTPAEVLARYAAALAKAEPSTTMTFDYSVEQLGLRNLEQTHRVYRSAHDERDETTVIDGQQLTTPVVRIFSHRIYRYDLHALAPTPATYSFAYVGAHFDGESVVYVFHTTPLEAHAFGISEIELPSRWFLPTVMRFTVSTPNAVGTGQFAYGPIAGHWVISQASVNAKLASGDRAHERITWSNYQFPTSLPPSTFTAPRVIVEPDEEP